MIPNPAPMTTDADAMVRALRDKRFADALVLSLLACDASTGPDWNHAVRYAVAALSAEPEQSAALAISDDCMRFALLSIGCPCVPSIQH